ncbi:copper resistance protein NlpE [Parendozoicomonas haliclonae]|uniref:Lipoprotein NlpE n=1 Tax=Parendozoicomonas haliclonae TaxID=1960125 RepID=A0A1X7APQ1_9GAMM|nr:copper resistance protein NlpE [Parendozoicomonas haliclonae]SMA50225.1 Lipoprotein NlpE precursor [Parendozoicomonas haliclonae]
MKMYAALLVSVLSVAGCSSFNQDTNSLSVPPGLGDTARASVSWDGTYSGLLPCADCSGIQTTITLKPDGTYIEITEYVGKPNARYINEGRFTWKVNGRDIVLSNGEQYMVGEGQLFRLDQAGNRVVGSLANHYVLKKI